ncbi:MAG: hypothetical protein RIT14_1454 [Pseudomonadota bacterium]|jgi:hypothetical protein
MSGARSPLNRPDPALAALESAALSARVAPAVLDTRRARLTRIFQIGFNKCGTRSLYRFFQRSNIAAAHFNRGLLAERLAENLATGRKPLAGPIDRYVAYTDIQHVTQARVLEGGTFFRALYHYYPLSYFILNTRDKAGWIASRLRHGDGAYARRYGRGLGLATEAEVVARWSEDWDRHHAEVMAFFADKPGRLLVFDIKQDSAERLVAFLAPDFVTRAADFRHEGDSAAVDAETYRRNVPVRR